MYPIRGSVLGLDWYVCPPVSTAQLQSSPLRLALHAGQAVWYRLWWLLITPCVAGILEIIGWGARLWSSQSPFLEEPYFMQ